MKSKFGKLNDILSRLLFEKKMKPIDLAREVNVPQPTMHRIVSGKSTNPHISTLEPIAEFFDLSIEQLKGEAPLSSNKKSIKTEKKIIELPLYTWDKLENRTKPSEQHLAAMNDLSENCFATIMNDCSMEPHFSKHCTLIFDPDKIPLDRAFVLVKLSKTGLYLFRQLLIDAEHRFIKPLNPDLNAFQMRLLEENDEIIAVLVEARQTYSEL